MKALKMHYEIPSNFRPIAEFDSSIVDASGKYVYVNFLSINGRYESVAVDEHSFNADSTFMRWFNSGDIVAFQIATPLTQLSGFKIVKNEHYLWDIVGITNNQAVATNISVEHVAREMCKMLNKRYNESLLTVWD